MTDTEDLRLNAYQTHSELLWAKAVNIGLSAISGAVITLLAYAVIFQAVRLGRRVLRPRPAQEEPRPTVETG
ncbi:hypothetical protein GCM10012275_27850 [Longimycelium tulufanense]|uniref:Uncharacterized protein n=1 Tax=Longimycelium tulufanense TaxID=907463 RepID=A0A8J3CEL0_9PSEU|nr:hypothetical protein GCM10012275_27850 [Longimycelium tulufanense]